MPAPGHIISTTSLTGSHDQSQWSFLLEVRFLKVGLKGLERAEACEKTSVICIDR